MPDDVPSSGSVNLSPGNTAPTSGTYVCCYCGPGGLAECLVVPTRLLPNPRSGARPILRNTDLTTPLSRRTTIYDIAEDERLPHCPSCGDVTGWDLLTGTVGDYFRSRVQVRETTFAELGIVRAEPADPEETGFVRLLVLTGPVREVDPRETVIGHLTAGSSPPTPCDVCGYPVAVGTGHLLTTPQVLGSEAYWSDTFRRDARRIDELPDRETQERYFDIRVRKPERDRTAWLVCDHCTELFLADWTTARDHVRRGTRPRGPGRFRNRFRLSTYISPAARAWTRERGWWPARVTAPQEPDDRCDLCAKPLYPGETVSMVKTPVIEEWADRGLLATPERPPRPMPPDQHGWLGCMSCYGRVLSRIHHAES